jgi:hypothetical protein
MKGGAMKVDNRFVLLLVMLGVFVLYVAGLGVLVVYVLKDLTRLDPAMTLLAGLGAGLILEFFLAMLTLSWQFNFRKKEES